MGLNDLINRSADPLAPVLLLAFGTGFGMAGIAWRVMAMLPDDARGERGRA